jgi:eukaryotic-like serine/threonine-protein kinase
VASAAAAVVETIGRFQIESELGRGAQGTVFLAVDPHLERQVAVKTLRVTRHSEDQRAGLIRIMLDEARIVGKLQHPNIVALFDAGEANGLPYLVFEFVEGDPLSRVIARRGAMPPAEAVAITIPVLRALSYAHERRVVHRDIKPANIMITAAQVPRIMDFGIAARTDMGSTSVNGISGTPRYMAPEYLNGGEFTPACDVFAAGMVLYEMAAGVPAVRGNDPHAIMYAMVRQPFERPSQHNPAVDERLERIIMRALEKEPSRRFADAAEMIEALTEYTRPKKAAAAGDDGDGAGDGTGAAAGASALDYVLRRMRFKSDFPVLSSTISSINSVAASDSEPASAFAESVLKDVALTNKLLRMVNTAGYSQFGGAVSTVSRAVSILGFQKVRAAALSLMLFEHLQNKAQAADLKDLVSASYFSGMLSRELGARLGLRNIEEGFICSMFHRLGKLLANFYLHEEASDAARLARSENIEEDEAAREVLGITYTDLGAGIAARWNLPERIVRSMAPVQDAKVPAPVSDEQKLRVLSDLSNRLCDAAAMPDPGACEAALRKLATKYASVTGLDSAALSGILQQGAAAFAQEVKSLDLPVGSGAFVQQLRLLGGGGSQEAAAATRPAASAASATTPGAARGPATLSSAPEPDETVINLSPSAALATADPAQRQSMLTAGIADITSTLAGSYGLNDVLRIILETMYRAMRFKRVMLFTYDARSQSLKARFGFGGDTAQLVSRGLAVPLQPARDVFSIALGKGADICVEERDSEKMRPHIPKWYRDAVAAHGFTLFPVLINGKPLALIYADSDDAASLRFAGTELNLLKALRDKAIVAIRQKSPA